MGEDGWHGDRQVRIYGEREGTDQREGGQRGYVQCGRTKSGRTNDLIVMVLADRSWCPYTFPRFCLYFWRRYSYRGFRCGGKPQVVGAG